MSLQCDNLSGELQDQWSSSYDLILQDQASGERSQDQWSSGSISHEIVKFVRMASFPLCIKK